MKLLTILLVLQFMPILSFSQDFDRPIVVVDRVFVNPDSTSVLKIIDSAEAVVKYGKVGKYGLLFI